MFRGHLLYYICSKCHPDQELSLDTLADFDRVDTTNASNLFQHQVRDLPYQDLFEPDTQGALKDASMRIRYECTRPASHYRYPLKRIDSHEIAAFEDYQYLRRYFVKHADHHVLCFFCSKIHSTHRASHCHNGLRFRSYHFKFPFPQNPKATAYEIDKAIKRYVALGASPPPAEQDSLDGAPAALKIERRSANTLSKWEDVTETVTIDDSDTVLRRLRQVLVTIQHLK